MRRLLLDPNTAIVFRVVFLAVALVALVVPTGCGDQSGGAEGDAVSPDAGDTQRVDGDGDVPCTGALCGGVCCQPGETCTGGVCAPASCAGVECAGTCCAAGQLCDNGVCSEACSGASCSGVCCGAGELCDAGTLGCAPACGDGSAPCGGSCCPAGRACEAGQCRAACAVDETRCGNQVASETCCSADETCQNGVCELDCGAAALCGPDWAPVCCGADEVCEASVCKPDCAGTRCGPNDNLCCAGGHLCLFDACVAPQGPCTDNFDCAINAYCETSVGQCILVDDNPNQCIYVPPVGQFAPEQQWAWSGSAVSPTYNQVMMTPIVINLTDDNGDTLIDEDDIPDVVFGTFAGGGYNSAGVIRVVSGDDGRELAASSAEPFSVSSDLGAADLDYDGRPEIVVSSALNAGSPRRLYALNLLPDGSGGYQLSVRDTITLSAQYDASYAATAAAFADLEGNGTIEIVSQYGITNGLTFDHRCEGPGSWYFPVVADLNEDGKMEIVVAGSIFDTQCTSLASGASGLPAVADLVPDSGPDDLAAEIVWIRSGYVDGTVEVWNVTYDAVNDVWGMSKLWAGPIPLNLARIQATYGYGCPAGTTDKGCNTGGGPPTIADFDGDGQPEIGVAARWYYVVYETDGSVLWADATTKDYSSAVTGSSVFDFEGDGAAEVVYNDEGFLRVYKGSGAGVDGDGDGYADPLVLFQEANPSGTLYEYPLIVDVDNDGNAEIVVAANNYAFAGANGIRVFRDPLDNWVRTRRIWNQHTYHVTNIEENGSVPLPERANWRVPRLNNFRQNVQPGGLFNAPNLVPVALSSVNDQCPSALVLQASVSNDGALGVPAGLWVGFYAVGLAGAESRALLGRAQVPTPIPPGQSRAATLVWNFSATMLPSGTSTTLALPVDVEAVVDDPPAAVGQNGEHNECVETDNTSATQTFPDCPVN